MHKLLLICQFLILSGVGIGVGQDTGIQEINVRSWKTGDTKVLEQVFDIILSAENPEFSREILGLKGEVYILRVVHMPSTKSALTETGRTTEGWVVELIQRVDNQFCPTTADNLLKASGLGSGGDYFPRDDLVGYLFPKTTSKISSNGVPMINGKFYYPISLRRRIVVESFEVVIKVVDYKYDSKDKNAIDSMKVHIEFKNL